MQVVPYRGRSATADEAAGLPRLTFWQRPFAQNALPFVTSLVLHVAIITLGLVTATAIKYIVTARSTQVIIPEVSVLPGTDAQGILYPGLGGDPTRPALQDLDPNVLSNADSWGQEPPKIASADLMGSGGGDTPTAAGLIGVGANSGLYGQGHSIGLGKGDLFGSGTGRGVALAPFGIPGGGGGAGPRLTFVGITNGARKVVFICDASGSMMQKFEPLRVELRKAINGLSIPQSFNVVFFQETSAASIEKSLLVANPNSKRKAMDFLDAITPRGPTDPLPALKLAFGMNPEVVFLLTDGDFPDNGAVVEECNRLNASKHVKINTIAFLDRGEVYEKVLKQIATENGGVFRYVSPEELGQ